MDESDGVRGDTPGLSLREAVRAARAEAAERSGVIVELRDAALVRLSMLNELLDPVFADIPLEHADLFDRGLMPGETPRLFVDMVAHVALGRDRRTYRFLQDTRAGRRVLAESTNPYDIVDAATRYIARRLIAREQAMVAVQAPPESGPLPTSRHPEEALHRTASGRGRPVALFLLGILVGALAMVALVALSPQISVR